MRAEELRALATETVVDHDQYLIRCVGALLAAADTIEELTSRAGGPIAPGSENEGERSSPEPAPSEREIAADAILVYWLNGTRDPDLAEWWQTLEAAECAAEMADAILSALEASDV